MRLCRNTGASLHLIEPLGFSLDEPRLKRAGLDYADWSAVQVHENLAAFLTAQAPAPRTLWAFSTRGRRSAFAAAYQPGDCLLFGPETRGLPQDVLTDLGDQQVLRLPMQAGSRSLNLSNAVAVAVYEAWRQIGFEGRA